jgi:hypothetical protein
MLHIVVKPTPMQQLVLGHHVKLTEAEHVIEVVLDEVALLLVTIRLITIARHLPNDLKVIHLGVA